MPTSCTCRHVDMLVLQRGFAASQRLTLAVACGQTSTLVLVGRHLLEMQSKYHWSRETWAGG
eukprot:1918208-Lingulodinium_polyedra.AAC.1